MKGRGISTYPFSQEDRPDIEQLLVGKSESMQMVKSMIQQLSMHTHTTVLLQGDTGTGKDVAARALHLLTHGSMQSFVAINCAAIPDQLLETELFGVENGAFTDAKARDGYLFLADGGTLFLDEIGEMKSSLQAKLLRFLETKTFRRIGGTKEFHVNLRVISATSTDLKVASAQKSFREDLFYRLQVFTIHLPLLRERPEDIEQLVAHYLAQQNATLALGERSLRVHRSTMELLVRYNWPGNVRQLYSALQYGSVLCEEREIFPGDLPYEVRLGNVSEGQQLQDLCQQMHLPSDGTNLLALFDGITQRFVNEALERCGGNQVRAAALLGLSRDQLRHRLKRI